MQKKVQLATTLKQYAEQQKKSFEEINKQIGTLKSQFDNNKLTTDNAQAISTEVTKQIDILKKTIEQISSEKERKALTVQLDKINNYPLIIKNLAASASVFDRINNVSKFKGKLRNNIKISVYYTLNEQANLKPFLDYCFSKFITDKKLLTATALSKELASLKSLSEAKLRKKFRRQSQAQQEPEQTTQSYDVVKKNLIKSIKSLKIPDVLKALINNSIISKAGEDSDDLLLKCALFFSTYKKYLDEYKIQYSSDLAVIGSLSEQLLKEFGTN
jgi:hypothetical protein